MWSLFQITLMRLGFSGWGSSSGVLCLHILSSYIKPTLLSLLLLPSVAAIAQLPLSPLALNFEINEWGERERVRERDRHRDQTELLEQRSIGRIWTDPIFICPCHHLFQHQQMERWHVAGQWELFLFRRLLTYDCLLPSYELKRESPPIERGDDKGRPNGPNRKLTAQ